MQYTLLHRTAPEKKGFFGYNCYALLRYSCVVCLNHYLWSPLYLLYTPSRLYQGTYTPGIIFADPSFLFTALEGDQNILPCVGWENELIIVSPRNYNTDFAYIILCLRFIGLYPRGSILSIFQHVCSFSYTSTLGGLSINCKNCRDF